MRKQPERTEQTRQDYIDVFCELYSKKPIEKITVQEITNLSGYNRSTFYQYFCDIYELLEYVENDIFKFIKSERERLGDEAKTLEHAIRMFEEKEKYVKALLGDYGSVRFLDRIKKELLADIISGETSTDDPTTAYLLEFHISTVISLYRLWQKRGKDLPLEDMVTLVHKLHSGGTAAMKVKARECV